MRKTSVSRKSSTVAAFCLAVLLLGAPISWQAYLRNSYCSTLEELITCEDADGSYYNDTDCQFELDFSCRRDPGDVLRRLTPPRGLLPGLVPQVSLRSLSIRDARTVTQGITCVRAVQIAGDVGGPRDIARIVSRFPNAVLVQVDNLPWNTNAELSEHLATIDRRLSIVVNRGHSPTANCSEFYGNTMITWPHSTTPHTDK
jgi:hypothetical protein